jgi:predicted esterase
MTNMWRIGCLWACAVAAGAAVADAQVVVHLKDGQKMVGESVLREGEDVLEIKICHSHTQKIPKAAVLRHESFAPAPAPPSAAAQPAARTRLDDEQRVRRENLVREFLAGTDRRAEVLAEIRRDDAVPRQDVGGFGEFILRAAREVGPKLREGDFVFEHPTYKGQVHVEIHKGPAPPAAKAGTSPQSAAPPGGEEPYALVVLLHGGGKGDGHWSSGAGLFMGAFRGSLGRVIFLCPNVLEKRYAEWGSNPAEEAYVKELIKAAKRTWPIDTDRVYCAGYSMGGYGTWHYGGHQADVFAGLVSGAGGILLGMRRGETWGWGVLSNLQHTSIAFAHAKDDEPSPVWSDQVADRILNELAKERGGGYVHRYTEYEKGGHGGAQRGMADAVKWAAAHQRNPHPRSVVWEPSRPFIRHFHWLQVDKPRFFTRIEADIQGNTIDLKLTGIGSGFSILLNEQLVDMDQPVTVRCEGRKLFEGKVQPALSAMLESIEDKLDNRMWYWGRIDF